ncbi:MAG: GDSL-type esterase/lipase family protein [Alphaproteobacteria bacterium]
MSRRWTIVAAALTVSVVLAVGGLELALRVYQWLSADTRIIVTDPVLHHRLRGNLDVVVTTYGAPMHLLTNALGWPEERDFPEQKPAGTVRIFQIGDSNTQGRVNHAEKMTELLEARLNADAGQGGPRYEVINTGTSSWSNYVYYLAVREQVLRFQPDLVVINVDMTDVANDYMYRRFAVRDADGSLRALVDRSETNQHDWAMTPTGVARLRERSGIGHWLVAHTALGYYADKLVARLRWSGALGVAGYDLDESANWLAADWPPSVEAAVADSFGALDAAIALLRRHGVAVALTGVPHLPQFRGRWSARPHEALAAFARSRDVPYLDMYRVLAEAGTDPGPLYWGNDDTHFNAAGHRRWAEAQYRFLSDPANRLLPARPR